MLLAAVRSRTPWARLIVKGQTPPDAYGWSQRAGRRERLSCQRRRGRRAAPRGSSAVGILDGDFSAPGPVNAPDADRRQQPSKIMNVALC